MKPTQEYLVMKFQEYNHLMFHDALPMLPLKVSHSLKTSGSLKYKKNLRLFRSPRFTDFSISVSDRFEWTEEEIQDTLIHEMIHYYICYNQLHDTSSHGHLFRSMMKQINETFNRHISVSHKINDTQRETDQRKVPHFICVSQLEDGRTGYTFAAQSRVKQLNRLLPRFYSVKSINWYYSESPFFNRFPRSIKPKIYIINNERLDEEIKKATKIEKNYFDK